MTPEEIIVLLAGIQLISMTFLVNASSFFYISMFKIIPFFLGLGCLWTIRSVYL